MQRFRELIGAIHAAPLWSVAIRHLIAPETAPDDLHSGGPERPELTSCRDCIVRPAITDEHDHTFPFKAVVGRALHGVPRWRDAQLFCSRSERGAVIG